jgi:hypothetical protein
MAMAPGRDNGTRTGERHDKVRERAAPTGRAGAAPVAGAPSGADAARIAREDRAQPVALAGALAAGGAARGALGAIGKPGTAQADRGATARGRCAATGALLRSRCPRRGAGGRKGNKGDRLRYSPHIAFPHDDAMRLLSSADAWQRIADEHIQHAHPANFGAQEDHAHRLLLDGADQRGLAS